MWTKIVSEKIDKIMIPEAHRIIGITHETQAEFTFRVAFDKPFRNGQFCMLSIPKFGEAPISISGKGDGYVEFTIRKVGRLTKGLFDLREGGTLFLRGPYGSSWPVEEIFAGSEKSLLVVSGGTGLAPVRTTLNWFYENPDQIKDLYLISGFKDIDAVLFEEDRAKWSKAENFHTIYTLDNSEAPGFETGMVTAHLDKIPFDSFGDDYCAVVVGPPPMMHFTALGLMKLGVPDDKIWVSYERRMQCAVGKCGHCKINETYVCLEGPVFHYPKAKEFLY